jgi:acetolactate decarboxylase
MSGVAVSAVLALCMTGDASAKAKDEGGKGMVRIFGALKKVMHDGDTGPKANLGDLVPGPHTYAVGALSELRGEIAVVDDKVFAALGNSGAATWEGVSAGTERAALLVVADVPAWSAKKVERDIPAEQLEAFVETELKKSGLDPEQPWPILIKGPLLEVKWHVLAGGSSHEESMKQAVRGTLPKGTTATLVGFFSRHHEGVFTHMGQRTHLHVVAEESKIIGHADSAGIQAGATLYLPDVQTSPR